MRTDLSHIPVPLQKQTLIRLGIGILFFILMIALLFVTRDIYILLPCAGMSVFFSAAAFTIFRQSVTGEYVVVNGIFRSVALTLIRRRAKYIVLQSGEKLLQVPLRDRSKTVCAGAVVELYAAKKAPIYEKDGVQILSDYLAIDIKQMRR